MNSNKSQIFFGVALSTFFVLSVMVLSPFLITLSLAIIASIILHPLYNRITKICWGNKSVGSLVTIFLFYILIFVPVSFVSFQIFKEAKGLYSSIDTPNASDIVSVNNVINNSLSQIIPNSDIHVEKYIGEFSSWILSNLGKFFTGTFDIIIKILLVTISLFFLLKDSEKFRKNIKDLIPISAKAYDHLTESIELAVKSVVFGSIVVAIIQGIVSGIGLALFGIPNATLLGTLAIVASLIPGIGTGIVFIPIIIYSLFYGTVFNTICLLLWAAVVVNIIDTLLRPVIMHKSVGVHPLFILFAVIGGISFIGPAGFIIGPLILSLLLTLVRAYKMKDVLVEEENK